MPRQKQKREYLEDSSLDNSESSESDNDNILESYNADSEITNSDDESESEISTSHNETINGRPINKKKMVKKEYNDLRDVMFEHIDKDYAHGKLGEFEVIMMKKNGYVNASKLCNSAGKRYAKWIQNNVAKDLINELKSADRIRSPLFINVIKGRYDTRGTYVHPKLIVHIASWCSPKYALMVSDIVNEYHIKQAIEIKDKLLNKKDDKIDKLNKKIDILLKDNEDFRRRDDIMSYKVDHLVDEIDIKSDNYVVEGNPNTRHILVIIKTNELPHKLRNKKGKFIRDVNDKVLMKYPQFDYIALRVMKKSYKSRINSIKKEFPDMDILLEIKYTPNSMNLWGRIKKELNRKKIAVTGSRFKRLVGYSEKRMIREIQKIHDERFEYDD